jgi:2-methylcitrate dehydratase PrpD
MSGSIPSPGEREDIVEDQNVKQGVALRLAHFVNDIQWRDISEPLRHDAKRSLVNFFAGAIGVSHDPEIDALVAVLGDFCGPREATVIGRAERMDALSASTLNAISANLLDFDDTHLNTVIHPTAPVAPPVLALAERHGYAGEDVLLAFILGAEIECRIGNAVSPHHYARGWHITATCGIFGAAVAAAKLRRLSPEQTAHALGIAASQSAGLVENLPSGAKNVGVGHAARNGLFAALMAERGYSAAATALEGPLGWARACGDELNVTRLFADLGAQWELSKNTFKPYPCGIVMHAVVDACLELRERYQLTAAQIESVCVRGDALLLARGDRMVRNARDARVSIHHCATAPFLWGRAGIEEFSQARVMCDEAVAFRSIVHAKLDTNSPLGAATVRVRTRSGDTYEVTVEQARGSIEKPLSDAELEAKVYELASERLPHADIAQLLDRLWRLDEMATIDPLMALVSVPD